MPIKWGKKNPIVTLFLQLEDMHAVCFSLMKLALQDANFHYFGLKHPAPTAGNGEQLSGRM